MDFNPTILYLIIPITRHLYKQHALETVEALLYLVLFMKEPLLYVWESNAQCVLTGAPRLEQAGIYWKINRKSSHLNDKEKALTELISCVATLTPPDM